MGLLDQIWGATKDAVRLERNPWMGLLGDVWDNMDALDKASLAASPVPVVGDLAGLGNDIRHYYNEPESLTWGNAGLSAMGLLPFVPPVAGVMKNTSKVANDLPMDEASRMARAKEMGFDTDTVYYHGTSGDVAEFNKEHYGKSTMADSALMGTWMTSASDEASEYAELASQNKFTNKIQNQINAAEKNNDWDKVDDLTRKWEDQDAKGYFGDAVYPVTTRGNFAKLDANGKNFTDISNELWDLYYKSKRHNLDGIDVVNLLDRPRGVGLPTNHRVVFSPNNIRSKFAKFDPSKKDSANLLASGLLGAFGLSGAYGLLGQDQYD